MYKRSDYLQSTDTTKQSMAILNKGLDWNYKIAPKIDRDLHEKLLKFDSSLLIGFVQLLPLISSGYFYTARTQIKSLTVDESLNEVKEWLIESLKEADDTEG